MTRFTRTDALHIGTLLGIDWRRVNVDEFTTGMNVELEHGQRDPATDVTHDDPLVTGKIALAHLHELPDYYTRLARIEAEAAS